MKLLLCDRVALIQKGQILSIDTPEKIVDQYKHPLYLVISDDMYSLQADLRDFPEAISAHRFGDSIHFASSREIDNEEIHGYLTDKGHQIIEFIKITPDIEDCFMALMKDED